MNFETQHHILKKKWRQILAVKKAKKVQTVKQH